MTILHEHQRIAIQVKTRNPRSSAMAAMLLNIADVPLDPPIVDRPDSGFDSELVWECAVCQYLRDSLCRMFDGVRMNGGNMSSESDFGTWLLHYRGHWVS